MPCNPSEISAAAKKLAEAGYTGTAPSELSKEMVDHLSNVVKSTPVTKKQFMPLLSKAEYEALSASGSVASAFEIFESVSNGSLTASKAVTKLSGLANGYRGPIPNLPKGQAKKIRRLLAKKYGIELEKGTSYISQGPPAIPPTTTPTGPTPKGTIKKSGYVQPVEVQPATSEFAEMSVSPTRPTTYLSTDMNTVQTWLSKDPVTMKLTGTRTFSITKPMPMGGRIKAFRVGPTVDSKNRGGVFFAGSADEIAEYAKLHPGHSVQEYSITFKNPIVAAHQNDITMEWFGQSYGDLHAKLKSMAALDRKILKEAKKRGHDGIIYLRPAPPAKTEIVIVGKPTKHTLTRILAKPKPALPPPPPPPTAAKPKPTPTPTPPPPSTTVKPAPKYSGSAPDAYQDFLEQVPGLGGGDKWDIDEVFRRMDELFNFDMSWGLHDTTSKYPSKGIIKVWTDRLQKANFFKGPDLFPSNIYPKLKADILSRAGYKGAAEKALKKQRIHTLDGPSTSGLPTPTSAGSSVDEILAPVLKDPDTSTWSQVGPQKGSNPGGLFVAPDGTKWYIKTPATSAHVDNEIIAGKLYKLAGVDSADTIVVNHNGKKAIASRFREGAGKVLLESELKLLDGTYSGFATDAFLANWDVIGLNLDNLLWEQGKALRIDAGGALLFRAQGAKKGAAFASTVGEIQTLRTMNPGAKVFGSMSDEVLLASMDKALKISEDHIYRTVFEFGKDLTGPEKTHLIDTLRARRKDLVKQRTALWQKIHKKDADLHKKKGVPVDTAEIQVIKKELNNLQEELETTVAQIQEHKGLTHWAREDYPGGLPAWNQKLKELNNQRQRAQRKYRRRTKKLKQLQTAGGLDAGPATSGPGQGRIEVDSPGAHRTFKDWRASLAPEELSAIQQYTASGYVNIRKAQRGIEFSGTPIRSGKSLAAEALEKAERIETALARAPKYKGPVTRGLSLPKEIAEELFVNADTFEMEALTSTSKSIESPIFKSYSSVDKYAVDIYIEKSYSGVYVDKISSNRGEREVLFRKGALFKVKKTELKKRYSTDKLPTLFVWLEEIT